MINMLRPISNWLLVIAVLLPVMPAARADDGPRPLVVCGVPASMPRTDKTPDGTPRGLDVAVAERVAKELGRPVEFHWCASGECSWHCLPEGRCDVVAGQPMGSGPSRGVAWSVPYAAAGFGLVVTAEQGGHIRSLGDLRGKRVGIVAGTVPISARDHTIERFRSREALLDGFHDRQLDAAFLDGDFAAWFLHEHPKLGLKLVEGFVARERWDMALAVRSRDGDLLVAINQALSRLAASGALRTIYREYGVPYRPPSSSAERRAEAPVDAWPKIQERGELAVSMDPDNLPYSSARAERPGLDVELARAVAKRLGLKLRIDWIDIHHETAVGSLIEGESDLAFGQAIEPDAVEDDAPIAGKVVHSRPYYTTGYVLVRRKDGPRAGSLAELKGERSRRLGAEAGSVADYRLSRRGYFRRLHRNQATALKALAAGEIDFAYLWANAGWAIHSTPELNEKLEIIPGIDPADRWPIAVAMRPADVQLKRRVDEAIKSLIDDGTVARLLAAYHIPMPVPIAGKVQTSRHPYDALSRIRSAGVLVVGLDQNNPPFSTAHPKPSGLDYEIAGMLAEQLGVSLRVFWAVAAHDSYPSKLTVRRHCDVILGVMPDDRFGDRVLYSHPYQVARYRMVVKAGASRPEANVPIAVERGIAVHGLSGRTLHEYPSTDAVLEAVATGRERAGYAIATRGAWLAHQHWPGRLQFLRAEDDATDAFPIVAAVRKSDPALRAAIDRAWDELDRSGRLARAFARWHIPYEPATRQNKG